jgi:hypothetical protein
MWRNNIVHNHRLWVPKLHKEIRTKICQARTAMLAHTHTTNFQHLCYSFWFFFTLESIKEVINFLHLGLNLYGFIRPRSCINIFLSMYFLSCFVVGSHVTTIGLMWVECQLQILHVYLFEATNPWEVALSKISVRAPTRVFSSLGHSRIPQMK